MADKLDFETLMQEAQKIKEKMEETQKEVEKVTVEGQSGGGWVSLTMNGRYEVLSLTIDPALLDEDKKVIEELIQAGFNDATQKLAKVLQDQVKKFTAGFTLPAQTDEKE